MALTQQQMRDQIRDYMLIRDLSNTHIDRTLQDANSQVERFDDWPWQHKMERMTIQRTGNVEEAGTIITDARRVLSLSVPEWGALIGITWEEAAALWPDNYGASADTPAFYTAIATAGARGGGVAVRVWPRYDEDIEDATVRYLTQEMVWPLSTDIGADTTRAEANEPDLPSPFHHAILRWALAEMLAREGQDGDAQRELQKFQAELQALARQYADVRADPVVVGGDANISGANIGLLPSVGSRRRLGLG